jgi:hypothetical protein
MGKIVYQIFSEEHLGTCNFKRHFIEDFTNEIDAMNKLRELNKKANGDVYFIMRVVVYP